MNELNTGGLDGDAVKNLLTEQRKPFILIEDDIHPVIVLPQENGYREVSLDRSALFPRPERVTGLRQFDDAQSLIHFYAAALPHQGVGEPRLYCDADFVAGSAVVTAVFNDSPGWRDFRAVYAPKSSVEWKRWLIRNGHDNAFTQETFALFIEDNLADIAAVEGMPSGSEMLAMATNLEVNAENRFKSAIRLQSGGVDLTYVDSEDDETLKKMKLFERFAIGIRVLQGGEAYRIDARLRYRTRDGKLTFWYELIRPDKTYEDALRAEIARIEGATGHIVLMGKAPA